MTAQSNVARYRANRQNEVNSAALYHALADLESHPQLAEVYRRLAGVEERHARFWEQKLLAAGQTVAPRRPGWQPRVLIWLARRCGPQFALPVAAALEQVDR